MKRTIANRAGTLAGALLLFAGTTGGEARAQPPDPGEYSQAEYEVDVTRGVLVPMRDGVRLSVDIYAPRGSAGPFPGILAHTPYDNNAQRETATWFAQRGYVVVSADARGRYDSEGEWDPFGALHRVDGYDLVEWVAAQPWCTGKVGMIGGSYLGWTQWWAASMAPPHLAAVAPRVSPPDPFESLPYQHGVLLGGWMLDWAAGSSGRTAQVADTGYYNGWPQHRADPPTRPTSRSTSRADCAPPRGSRPGIGRTGPPIPTGARSGTRPPSRTRESRSLLSRSRAGSTAITPARP